MIDIEKFMRPIRKEMEKLNSHIKLLEMKKICPFYYTFGNKIDCPYKEHGWNTCHDIQNAPGNGDAWCNITIGRGIIDTNLHFNETKEDYYINELLEDKGK